MKNDLINPLKNYTLDSHMSVFQKVFYFYIGFN